jgi:hypothetical protein
MSELRADPASEINSGEASLSKCDVAVLGVNAALLQATQIASLRPLQAYRSLFVARAPADRSTSVAQPAGSNLNCGFSMVMWVFPGGGGDSNLEKSEQRCGLSGL